MDIKEIAHMMFHNFFLIFGGSVIAMYVHHLIFGDDYIGIHGITALFIATALCSLTQFVFYAKKQLTRRQMLVRQIFHLAVVLAIILSTAFFMGWIGREKPVEILMFVGYVVVVYVFITIVGIRKSKKLADALNQKLRERFKE